MSSYLEKQQQIAAQIGNGNGSVRLAKPTSNLFRSRRDGNQRQLKAADFNQVLSVDSTAQTVEVEGMTPYETLSRACLEQHCMPKVVPQLKSITIGGAVSGIGIESSSFKYGLPHESIREMDVLLADGDVVTATPDNQYSDLFHGIPNSYGTLGYVLRLVADTVPVQPYVHLKHRKFADAMAFFQAVTEACQSNADFVDGTVFSATELVLTEARLVPEAPYTSDYTWLKIYYRSLQSKSEDYLGIYDYLWRWDTDWFWCSKNVFVQNLPARMVLGRRYLNSTTYQKVMRWNTRVGVTRRINAWLDKATESVIQDVDIPIENATRFLGFFQREIGISPVWICPIGGHDPNREFPFYKLNGEGLFINFGFWDVVPNPDKHPMGHFNRLVEDKVTELGGTKSLYSDSYYDRESFWQLYNGDRYQALKEKYDPNRCFKDLYQKCVLKQ